MPSMIPYLLKPHWCLAIVELQESARLMSLLGQILLVAEWKLASCGASFELGKCWSDTSNFVTTRFFWPRSNRKRSNDFLAFSKVHLSTVIEALTGHCPLGIYAVRLTILPVANCLNEHEIESSQHFLFECPSFNRSSLKYLDHTLLNIQVK